MDAAHLLMVSVALFVLGAIASLLLNRYPVSARLASGLTGLVGSALALAAAVMSAISGGGALSLPSGLIFGPLTVEMDGLSALMVAMISLLSFAVSLYSFSYSTPGINKRDGLLGFLLNLFSGVMLLVVTVSNAFWFLVFWEMMTLVSYFLVIFEGRKQEVVRAGYLYIFIAHAGGALIMIAFFLLYGVTGSFNFAAFRQAQLSPELRDIVFLLAFAGFGAKAGMVPLHMWMPPAYAAAPSNATALMSTVMKKTAIYGILRFCVDLLGPSVFWWGMLLVVMGILSATLGALFALSERDLKRVLAYSSIENVGIILLGIGTGMVGLATNLPAIALVGFLAALYHALNHSFFKGLLFLGAGAVEQQVGTSNLNKIGGLGKRMPWTALTFLTGALAVSSIPPFNGFVSEWFTFQGLFTGSLGDIFGMRAVFPLCAALLALAGTLAAMAAIKTYGSVFTGPPRTETAAAAQEVPGAMRTGMGILAIGCVLLGLGAPLVTPYLAGIVVSTFGLPGQSAANATWVYPVDSAQALLSTPWIALLLLGFLLVPLMLVAIYGGRKAGARTVQDPWNCGYAYSPQMSVSASSFDQPVGFTFNTIYALRAAVQKPVTAIGLWAKRPRDAIARAEPLLEYYVREPITRSVEYLGRHIQGLQTGDVRLYCLYIIVTLAILLLVIFR
jgi:hydrogenase-4 component B